MVTKVQLNLIFFSHAFYASLIAVDVSYFVFFYPKGLECRIFGSAFVVPATHDGVFFVSYWQTTTSHHDQRRKSEYI